MNNCPDVNTDSAITINHHWYEVRRNGGEFSVWWQAPNPYAPWRCVAQVVALKEWKPSARAHHARLMG